MERVERLMHSPCVRFALSLVIRALYRHLYLLSSRRDLVLFQYPHLSPPIPKPRLPPPVCALNGVFYNFVYIHINYLFFSRYEIQKAFNIALLLVFISYIKSVGSCRIMADPNPRSSYRIILPNPEGV